MSDRPEPDVHQQTAFDEGGQLEVTESSVETTLKDFGASVNHHDRNSRMDRPEATEFVVDDRPKVTCITESDHSNLFTEIADDQQTLTGDDAAMQCLFDE